LKFIICDAILVNKQCAGFIQIFGEPFSEKDCKMLTVVTYENTKQHRCSNSNKASTINYGNIPGKVVKSGEIFIPSFFYASNSKTQYQEVSTQA